MKLTEGEMKLRNIARDTAEIVVSAKTEATLRVTIRAMQLLFEKGLLDPDDMARFVSETEKDARELAMIAPTTAKELDKLAEYLRHTLPNPDRKTN